MEAITQDRVERVARMYHSNQDASRALGIAMRSFSRLCRRFDVETPYARRRRRIHECGSPVGPSTAQRKIAAATQD